MSPHEIRPFSACIPEKLQPMPEWLSVLSVTEHQRSRIALIKKRQNRFNRTCKWVLVLCSTLLHEHPPLKQIEGQR